MLYRKRFISATLFLSFVLTFISSCGVQKRKYQKGYFVEHRSDQLRKVKQKPGSDKVTQQKEQFKSFLNESSLLSGTTLGASSGEPSLTKISAKAPTDSCDLIIFKDGSEVPVTLIEISSRQIKYKKCSLPDGPLFITNKTDLFMIKYVNGTKELMKTESAATPQQDRKGSEDNTTGRSPTFLATNAFVFSLIGLYPLFFPASIAALIMASIQINRIETEPNRYAGLRKARAARIIAMIGLFLSFCLFTIVLYTNT